MTSRLRAVGESPLWLSGVLLLALMVAVDIVLQRQINGAYAGAAVLTAIYASPQRTALVSALALAMSVASGAWNDNLGERDWAIRFATCVVICGLALIASNTNRKRQQRLERTTAMAQGVLDALAVELTGARTVREVADGFLGRAVAAMGATSAMVMSLDSDDVLRTLTWHGRRGNGADQYQEVPLSSDVPGAVAVREDRDIHYRSVEEIVAAFPALAGYYPDDRSLHLLPLRREDRTYGLLAITFPPDVLTHHEDGFLHSLAGALASAVERAAELQRADAATHRTTLLGELSMSLSRSLDTGTTVAECGRILVPRFADWCSLQLLRDGQLETVAINHRDPETTAWAESLRGAFPTRMDGPTGAAQVVRTGESVLYPFIPADLIEAAADGPEHLELLQRLGLTSAMVVPLHGRDGVIGALTLIHAESGRRYGDEDVEFLEAVADRVAVALETAATFEHQSQRLAGVTAVAEAAQRAILAPPPARTGPVTLSARYHSAAFEAQVGGDLYEVVQGPSSVRLLVGDVRGKGLSAVRTATVVLGEFRAAAAGPGDVAHVAREIDRRIRPYLPDAEDFVTGVLVDIRYDGTFDVVSCGHPAPVVLRASGHVRAIELDHEPPLGLGVQPTPVTGRLEPGDRMLLFTDGLIEARSPLGGFIDPTPFLARMQRAEFESALDDLLDGLVRATGHELDDDLALLLACYDPEPVGLDAVEVTEELVADPANVGRARRLLRAALDGVLDDALAEPAELLLSEVVTNAFVHAGGIATVRVRATPVAVRVEVEDGSSRHPTRRGFTTTAGTGRGLRLLDELADRWGSAPRPEGKVVWFELGTHAGALAATNHRAPADPDDGSVHVRLREVPLLVHAGWQEDATALLREYLLHVLEEDQHILERHARASAAMTLLHEQVPAPQPSGGPAITADEVVLSVPREMVAWFATLDELLGEAIAQAREGRFLSPSTGPEIDKMRQWLCREVARQADGGTPTPWAAPDPARG
ncbi:SpoIIE family protein phosphatase [Nocardioides KLBMP 9356]|uniref:SpoIIE family protein phosphatase n=1 Tax=Nocardioides potassii TaxID=2911371 RepID=A0ABS9HD13_9ACTN|nr:SpoIIE family protein phosphatase [Nocardioides potassii]MCF6378006.1 SpoIIE family protein phosphatase [Nocardioides potassii]